MATTAYLPLPLSMPLTQLPDEKESFLMRSNDSVISFEKNVDNVDNNNNNYNNFCNNFNNYSNNFINNSNNINHNSNDDNNTETEQSNKNFKRFKQLKQFNNQLKQFKFLYFKPTQNSTTSHPLLSTTTISTITITTTATTATTATSTISTANITNTATINSSSINLLPRILLLLGFALISLGGIITLITTIPDLSLPTSLEAVKSQAIILEDYSNGSWKGYCHIVGVFSVIYIWKQAFSVPGAIFLNLLAGALYGPFEATMLTSFLTSIGASAAYYLSKYAGKPLVDQCFSERLDYLRRQVDNNRKNLFFYLLFIRLFPLSPWWLLNLTSPLLSIPISSFFTSMFIGSIPYNLACAQAGNILSELQSTTDIWQPVLLLKMILVSLLSLLPPLIGKRLKTWKTLQRNNYFKSEQDLIA